MSDNNGDFNGDNDDIEELVPPIIDGPKSSKQDKSSNARNSNATKNKHEVYAPDKVDLKRSTMLESIRKGNRFTEIFKDNPLLKGGMNMFKEMKDWNMETKCNVCEELWFDKKVNGNAICIRCRIEVRQR